MAVKRFDRVCQSKSLLINYFAFTMHIHPTNTCILGMCEGIDVVHLVRVNAESWMMWDAKAIRRPFAEGENELASSTCSNRHEQSAFPIIAAKHS